MRVHKYDVLYSTAVIAMINDFIANDQFNFCAIPVTWLTGSSFQSVTGYKISAGFIVLLWNIVSLCCLHFVINELKWYIKG